MDNAPNKTIRENIDKKWQNAKKICEKDAEDCLHKMIME